MKACMLPILTFRAEAWWPPSNTRQKIRALAGKLDLIQNIAFYAILPAYKTTPMVFLHQAARILPIKILLDFVSRKFAACLPQLDRKHPLQIRKNSTSTCSQTYLDFWAHILPATIAQNNPLKRAP